LKLPFLIISNVTTENGKSHYAWIYRFLERHRLLVCAITRVGQKSSDWLESVCKEAVTTFNERFQPGGSYEKVPKRFWLNMDQTNVYFEPKSRATVATTGIDLYILKIVVAIRDVYLFALLLQPPSSFSKVCPVKRLRH
jgi:hypothetical protein